MLRENRDIVEALQRIADLLELIEANPFRMRAYRNAAWTLAEQNTPIAQWIEEGRDLTDLPSIGKDMAAVVTEFVSDGKLRVLDELATEVPLTLTEVMGLPGLGAGKTRKLWRHLGISDLASLEAAGRQGKISKVPGFGKKTEESILRRIEARKPKPEDSGDSP